MNVLAERATGRFPAPSKAVHDGTPLDAGASFAAGLDWVLDAVAATLTPPPPPSR